MTTLLTLLTSAVRCIDREETGYRAVALCDDLANFASHGSVFDRKKGIRRLPQN
jgi:hypothetical protein